MGAMSTKLFGRLFGRSEIRIALVGLDFAGKTTILYKLKLGEVVEDIATIGFNIETVEFKNVSFVVWDISIKDKQLWKHFFHSAQVLVFVVDSNCRDRILEAKDMLHLMLNSEEMQDKILLVLANKQDLPSAMNVIEITEKLDLYSLKQRLWYVQTTCATSGAELHEGLDWLSRNIDN